MIRPVLGWLIGLAALAVVALVAGVMMVWISTSLLLEVNAFFSGSFIDAGTDEQEYLHYEMLNRNAYLLTQWAGSVLLTGLVALFALLAVLARRWELTRAT